MQKRTRYPTTYERRITTLSGDRLLSIPIKYCKEHGVINTNTHSIFNNICPKWRIFDTKVMIAIGFLRWLFNYQREEIKLFLKGRGINISTGEISNLSEEFLLRFYVIYKNHRSLVRERFRTNKKQRLRNIWIIILENSRSKYTGEHVMSLQQI